MTPPLVYLGLDVAKASLACHLAGANFSLPNAAPGHAALCARIAAHGAAVQVVCEATGGYERPVRDALATAGLLVSVLPPARARQLARGLGFVAKTDALDATALAAIGALLQPPPSAVPTPAQAHLAALVSRRDQLVELARLEEAHAESTLDAAARRDLAQSLRALRQRIERFAALRCAHRQASA